MSKKIKRKRISLTKSIKILTINFLESYEWDTSNFENEEELINDLYFFWLKNSAERKYYWCQEISEEVFSIEFANNIKKILRKTYIDLINKRKNSLKTKKIYEKIT